MNAKKSVGSREPTYSDFDAQDTGSPEHPGLTPLESLTVEDNDLVGSLPTKKRVLKKLSEKVNSNGEDSSGFQMNQTHSITVIHEDIEEDAQNSSKKKSSKKGGGHRSEIEDEQPFSFIKDECSAKDEPEEENDERTEKLLQKIKDLQPGPSEQRQIQSGKLYSLYEDYLLLRAAEFSKGKGCKSGKYWLAQLSVPEFRREFSYQRNPDSMKDRWRCKLQFLFPRQVYFIYQFVADNDRETCEKSYSFFKESRFAGIIPESQVERITRPSKFFGISASYHKYIEGVQYEPLPEEDHIIKLSMLKKYPTSKNESFTIDDYFQARKKDMKEVEDDHRQNRRERGKIFKQKQKEVEDTELDNGTKLEFIDFNKTHKLHKKLESSLKAIKSLFQDKKPVVVINWNPIIVFHNKV